MKIVKGLEGKKLGKLTVLKELLPEKGAKMWECLCECGNITKRTTASLTCKGNYKNCGCYRPRSKDDSNNAKHLYRKCRNSAMERDLDFTLTFEEFLFITKKDCFYCGEPANKPFQHNGKVKFPYYYNGIDRVNNNIGYILNNLVPCCYTCNMMKWRLNKDIFLKHIEKIHNYGSKNI